jgi:GNAT superfamily N-acetyltransferase
LIKIKEVSEENLDDILNICSGNRSFVPVSNPIVEKGRKLKRQWFNKMLRENRSYVKVGYLDEKPVAQVLFYPEEATPYLHHPRRDVIYLKCIFNSNAEAQRKGVADALMKSILEECLSGLECLDGRPSKLVVTRPFPHEGTLPLDDFYKKYGFKEGHQEMYLETSGKYAPMKVPEFQPLQGDHGRTIIVYNPDCEWGYYYATTTRDLIQGKHPDHPVEIFNSWEKPEEYKKRGGGWMLIAVGIIVNAQIPENPFSFWTDRDEFLRNVEKALK